MKKLVLLSFTLILFMSCKQDPQRYFADSAEIETVKAGINAYETANWDKWQSHFIDTAKIFVNSTKPLDVSSRLSELKKMSGAMSSYGFDHDEEYIEMVLDKEDETWVYYWSQHNATIAATGKETSIPVHLSIQFVDGKIAEEHIYFDTKQLNDAFAEVTALKAKEEANAKSEESNE